MTRTALVTGSDRGIGKATVTAFAAKGYNVGITYAHHEDKADALAADLEKRYNIKAYVFGQICRKRMRQRAWQKLLTRN